MDKKRDSPSRRELVADGLLVFGGVCLVIAGFLLGAVWGFATMGGCSCALALLIVPDEGDKGGGGR